MNPIVASDVNKTLFNWVIKRQQDAEQRLLFNGRLLCFSGLITASNKYQKLPAAE